MERRLFEVKIDASSIKVFSSALHLVNKVGRELLLGNYVESYAAEILMFLSQQRSKSSNSHFEHLMMQKVLLQQLNFIKAFSIHTMCNHRVSPVDSL